jgi:uncharacterized protein (DUF2267 family)
MQYATFLSTVEQAAGIRRDEAERAIAAVLRTLAERITGGEAADIAAFLPREIRRLLTDVPEAAEGFDLEEFLRRVAMREGTDRETAMEHSRAVFRALGIAVAPGELRDMVAQLPNDFEPLLEAAGVGRRGAMEAYDLVGRAAEIAGIDRAAARRAVEAVLETLAERISAGEVEDLERELPPNLRPVLERGLSRHREAVAMTADEFIDTLAEREEVGFDDAEAHTRAVFAALRELISGKEFSDMAAQLSDDYAPLLAGGAR